MLKLLAEGGAPTATPAPITGNSVLNRANIAQAINTAAGPITVTLPDATTCSGQGMVLWKTGTDTNSWTVQTQAGQKLGSGGLTSLTYTALGPPLEIYSDGTSWRILTMADPNTIYFRYYDTGAADSTADFKTAVAVAAAMVQTLPLPSVELLLESKVYNLNTAPSVSANSYSIVPLTGITKGLFTIAGTKPSVSDRPATTIATTQSPGWSAVSGQPSIFGMAAAGKNTTLATTRLKFRDLLIQLPANPRIAAIDALCATSLFCENIDIPLNAAQVAQSTAVDGPGIIYPGVNCQENKARNVNVQGCSAGIVASEHFDGDDLRLLFNVTGLALLSAFHSNHVGYMSAEWNKYDISGYVFGTGSVTFPAPAAGQGYQLTIEHLDIENNTAAGWQTSNTIFDTGNRGSGYIKYNRVIAGTGAAASMVNVANNTCKFWRCLDLNAAVLSAGPSITGTTNLGAGGVATVTGTDKEGFIQITAGTGAAANATVTLTFGIGYTGVRAFLFTSHDPVMGPVYPAGTGAAVTLTIPGSASLVNATSYFIYYQIVSQAPFDRI